jgi:hypothetical protein
MISYFEPLSLSHQGLVDDFFRRFPPQISEFTFTNLFIWRHHYQLQVSVMHDFLTLLGQPPGFAPFLFPPVGEGDIQAWARTGFEMVTAGGHRPRIGRVPGPLAGELASLPGAQLVLDRDNSDYVYLTADLIRLSGNRYHSQKNHVNRLKKSTEWEYLPLTPDLVNECLNLQEAWCRLRQCEESPSLLNEDQAIVEAFKHIDLLPYRGGVLRNEGQVQAFTIGELLDSETVVIHIEKANPEIPGLYTLINQQFLEKEWSTVRYVNREQDLGEPGLRKAKESYHPDHLVEKFTLFIP